MKQNIEQTFASLLRKKLWIIRGTANADEIYELLKVQTLPGRPKGASEVAPFVGPISHSPTNLQSATTDYYLKVFDLCPLERNAIFLNESTVLTLERTDVYDAIKKLSF